MTPATRRSTSASAFEAFAAFYDDHAAAVHASARLMYGPAQSEEVTRRVFVDAWRRSIWRTADAGTARAHMIVAVHHHGGGRARAGAAPRWRSLARGSQSSSADSVDSPADLDMPTRNERCALALTLLGRCSSVEVARLLNESEYDVLRHLRSALQPVGVEAARDSVAGDRE